MQRKCLEGLFLFVWMVTKYRLPLPERLIAVLPLATSLQQSQNGDTIKTVIITVHLENCIEFVWMHLPFDCINQ